MRSKLRVLVRRVLKEELGGGCLVCDRDLPLVGDTALCEWCEPMVVRIKMMRPELDQAAAISYGRSLRVNKK